MRTTIAVMCFAMAACVSVTCASSDCKGIAAPTAGDVEAGTAVTSGVCSLIEGVDDNGTVRTICATIEEVASVIAFILTLRTTDAGAMPGCAMLPGTSLCATSAERAKAVLFLVRARQARLMVDGGAK